MSLQLESPRKAVQPFPKWPAFEEEEIEAAQRVLASGKVNYWTGEEGKAFEKEFSAYIGSQYAIALSNGTVAIEVALHALGIPRGSEMVVTSRTFMASASAAVMRGVIPVFADIDPVSQVITRKSIEAVLSPKTRSILAVHLAGWPCDMDSIMALAEERGLKVIEDCAQAHGATYHGRAVGTIGHAAAWSFCQDKIMTTAGEGGMLTTNDIDVWRRAWSFKDHGKDYDTVFNKEHPPGFRWLHESFGSNYRLSEVQSAVGRIALKKLPTWLEKRRKFSAMLNEAFTDEVGLRITLPPPEIQHAYYKYYVFVKPEKLRTGWSRDRIMTEISSRGIPCYSGSCSEIYLEKAFERCSLQPLERLPIAKRLGETSLMFLVHPTLTEDNITDTIQVVKRVMQEATA